MRDFRIGLATLLAFFVSSPVWAGNIVDGRINAFEEYDWQQSLTVDLDSLGRQPPHREATLDLYEGQVLTGDTNKTIYVYCQTGVRAAHTWFVFHDLLGVDNVKNYDGSWQEWGNRTDSPIERS